MKHSGGDRVKTTEVMDKRVEMQVMDMYWDWVNDNMNAATDKQCKAFFEDLWQGLGRDWEEDETAFWRLEVDILKRDDGTYEVKDVVSFNTHGFVEDSFSEAQSTGFASPQPEPVEPSTTTYTDNRFA